MGKVGFIGSGVMGGAIIKGVVKTGYLKAPDIAVYDIATEKVRELVNETGIDASPDIERLCKECGYIFICVKPIFIDDVLTETSRYITRDAVVVSIAAGVTIKRIKSHFSDDVDVIRTMPNTPLIIGEGMTVICSEGVKDRQKADFVTGIFASMGRTQELPENLMSEVISLTGSSPAYAYMLIGAMAKAAIEMGIPENVSYKMGAQAVLGAARMVLETDAKPEKLISDVCSKGGATIEAVNKLMDKGFDEIIKEAMKACVRKAYELGGEVK